MKTLSDFPDDASLLRFLGLNETARPELWILECRRCGNKVWKDTGTSMDCQYCNPKSTMIYVPTVPLGLTDPTLDKWQALANCLVVFGPMLDEKNWGLNLCDGHWVRIFEKPDPAIFPENEGLWIGPIGEGDAFLSAILAAFQNGGERE